MPNRNMPHPPIGTVHQRHSPEQDLAPKIQKCLGTARYTERYMQPSPAQPRS